MASIDYVTLPGSPTPDISWSKLRAPLPWQHKVEGGTLTLSNVGRQDSGKAVAVLIFNRTSKSHMLVNIFPI